MIETEDEYGLIMGSCLGLSLRSVVGVGQVGRIIISGYVTVSLTFESVGYVR
jgi:hypothetical protein